MGRIMVSHTKPILTPLQREIETLQAESETLERNFNIEIKPLQEFVPEKSLLRITPSILHLEKEQTKLRLEQSNTSSQKKSSGMFKQIFSSSRSAENRQKALLKIDQHFNEAIRLLKARMSLDEKIAAKKAQSKQAIEALKTKVEKYISSKAMNKATEETSLFSIFKKKVQNVVTNNPDSVQVADALYAFLGTPDEGRRAALLGAIKENPGYSENIEFQKLLTQTQTMYGLSSNPTEAFRRQLAGTKEEVQTDIDRLNDYYGNEGDTSKRGPTEFWKQ